MRLGVHLPTWHGNTVTASDVLDWARLIDDAGFQAIAVHDKPNHDTWDPLATLAAVAAVTSNVRLVTAALLLPLRDEALVAKQAAVIDQVSGGRLDLGVAVGARADDFELFGRPLAGRGRRFERQLERLLELWAAALETRETGAAMGPAPAQHPHPRLLVGGYADAAIERAVRLGDGYIFGAPGVAKIEARIPAIRAAARSAGIDVFPVEALAYVLPSESADDVADGERMFVRYYGPLQTPFRDRVHVGTPDQVVEVLRRYEAAGVDVLHLVPVSRSISMLETVAAKLLPAFPSEP